MGGTGGRRCNLEEASTRLETMMTEKGDQLATKEKAVQQEMEAVSEARQQWNHVEVEHANELASYRANVLEQLERQNPVVAAYCETAWAELASRPEGGRACKWRSSHGSSGR
eukprot:5556177-Pyramimonas_sp.AAC.1